MKPIVGVVPTAHLFETDDFYKDNYIFVNKAHRRERRRSHGAAGQ